MSMTDKDRATFLELHSTLDELAKLADQLCEAIGSNDVFLVAQKRREIAERRTYLAQVKSRASAYRPTSKDAPHLAQIRGFAQRIANSDNLLRMWNLATGTIRKQGAVWCENALKNAPTLASRPTVSALFGRFQGVPAIIVSAGPSLDKNIHQIAAAKGKAVIIAGNRTFLPLTSIGCPPDITVVADSTNLGQHLVGPSSEVPTALVARVSCHPSTFALPVARLFSYSGGSPHEDWLLERMEASTPLLRSGGSVAHNSYDLAQRMGCDPIIFVGQDLAMDNGVFYSSATTFSIDPIRAVSADETTLLRGSYSRVGGVTKPAWAAREELLKVPGYYDSPVLTTRAMASFLTWFNTELPELGNKPLVINSTEGGARMERTVPLPLEQALQAHCRTNREISERLQDAQASFDSAAAAAKMQNALRLLRSGLDRAARSSDECRRLAEKCRSGTSPNLQRLRKKEKALGAALAGIQPYLATAIASTLTDVVEQTGEAKDLSQSLSLATDLHDAITTASRRLLPHVEDALTRLH